MVGPRPTKRIAQAALRGDVTNCLHWKLIRMPTRVGMVLLVLVCATSGGLGATYVYDCCDLLDRAGAGAG
jgi:hypothetical protein